MIRTRNAHVPAPFPASCPVDWYATAGTGRWCLLDDPPRAGERAPGGRGRRLVQVEFSEDAGLMASDGFHPGPGAYAEWGRIVADIMRQQLEPA